MAKKGKKSKKNKEIEVIKSGGLSKSEGISKIIVQHFEEPLFTISIVVLFLSTIIPFLGVNWIAQGLVFILFILGFLAIYFIYIYFKSEKKNYWFFLVPILIFFTAIFAWWAYERLTKQDFFAARDSSTFSLFFGISTLFYVIWMHKILKPSSAAILVLFISTLIIHLTPAFTPSYAPWMGKHLASMDDPYFHYRHAKTIVETGYVPEHETLAYPTNPPDFSESRFTASVLMGSLSTILMKFGFTVHDVAMIYPGVFSAFIVVVFYLLLRDLFWDMRPYNYAAAFLGAFMLMLNPAFATKALATNCEDDTLGMFLIVSSFLFFVISSRRKSLPFAFLSGFSFLLLNITWGAYLYAITVFGIFGVLYAIINFIHKKNCVEHIPYFVIPMLISTLYPLILHAQGELPTFTMPSTQVLFPLFGTLLVSFLLEMIRNSMSGRIEIKEEKIEDKLENLIQRYVFPTGVTLLLLTTYYLFFIISPNNFINYALALMRGAKQQEIIGMTTAEQRELCSSFNLDCLDPLRNLFGVGVIFGMGMVFVLLYFMFFKRSLGAAFILTWSLPMIYGVIQKSQYQFIASVPIVALGSTIGLIIVMNKKDIQGLRVIPTIILLFMPMMFFFLQGGMLFFGPFGGSSPMYTSSGEMFLWEGTLEWLGKQPSNIVVLTWWDYGHSITAVSNRTSILDNTKAERFMVQDIAKFHVLVENETDALEIARKYNATHVVIDFTMIGKSGAPHFIATSGLGDNIPLRQMKEITCINGGNCDHLLNSKGEGYAYTYINDNQSGAILIDLGDVYMINRTTIRLWNLDNRYYQYMIDVSTDGVNWQRVVDKTEGKWSGLQTDSFDDIKAHFVRITGTYASVGNEFRVVSVSVYNPRYEGSYMGYGQCEFSPGNSVIKPVVFQNEEGGFDMVSRLVFGCNIGLGLIFEIRNGQYSASNVYIVLSNGQTVPWQTWRDSTGASILGVQSLNDVLYGALHDPELPGNSIFKFDTYRTLVYVPKDEKYDFNKVMMTKLYLGDYLEEYQQLGLADPTIERPKYFKLVDNFRGNKQDDSYWGYVRVYKIIYPEEIENATSSENKMFL